MNEIASDTVATRAKPRRVDHVAIEVVDFDDRLTLLTEIMGMTVQRIGRLFAAPERRIAMVGDGSGFKLEVIEADLAMRAVADGAGTPDTGDRLMHVAWLADQVDEMWDVLTGEGLAPLTAPRDFEPARSRTATVAHPVGADIQLVRYAADSPDR